MRVPQDMEFEELHIMLDFDQPITVRELAEINRFLNQELEQGGEGEYNLWE